MNRRYHMRARSAELRGTLMLAASILISLLCALPASAQTYPITIQSFSVIPPYYPYFEQWRANPSQVLIVLSNSSTTPQEVWLSGYAESGSTRIETKDDFFPNPPRPIRVPAGGVITVSASDFSLFDMNAVRVRGSGVNLTTGQIPEGTYQICIRALDYNNRTTPLSPPSSPSCASFTIVYGEAPRPIAPMCDMRISPVTSPQNISFTWSVPSLPAGAAIVPHYRFYLHEITGTHSPDQAVRSTAPLYSTEASGLDLTVPLLMYDAGLSKPSLIRGRRYAWYVQVHDPLRRAVFRNNGRSEVCSFQYGEPTEGTGSGSGEISLQTYYPVDGDTLPWIPPHLIVRWSPYRDDLREMHYVLTVTGGGETFTNERTLSWPSGPRASQGAPSNDRAQLIIVNFAEDGNLPSWVSRLRKGVRYEWSVVADFRAGDAARRITATSNRASFVMGLRTARNNGPENGSSVPPGSRVTLRWQTPPPSQLNFAPTDLLTRRGELDRMGFTPALERVRLEVSRNRDLSAPLFTPRVLRLPGTGGYATGEDAAEFFTEKTHDLGTLSERGTYYWRVSYLNEDGSAYLQGPVWSFNIGEGSGGGGRDSISPGNCLVLAPNAPRGVVRVPRPPFSVVANPVIETSAIRGGRLQIWLKESATEDSASAMSRSPIFDEGFTGSAASSIRPQPALPSSSPLDLSFINETGSPRTFTATLGRSYVWRFTLRFDGARVRRDGVACTRDSVTSWVGAFTYDTTSTSTRRDTGACRDDCSSPEITDRTPATRAFTTRDTLRVGRFTVALTEVSGTGGALTGSGVVRIPFINAGVRVRFSGVQVNSAGVVFNGEVFAETASDSPIDAALANQFTGALGMNLPREQFDAVQTFVSQSTRLVTGLTGAVPMSLPIGFDNVIAGERMVLGIVGMVFRPTGAYLNAAMSYPLPSLGPGIGVGVGARNICFHPSGIGGDGKATLYLAADLGYRRPSTWGFVFKAPVIEGGAIRDSGTYVSWDCRGFQALRIKCEVEFPRDWLLPIRTDGTVDADPTRLVKASFATTVRTGGNWLVHATMDRFAPAGAPDFAMEVRDLVIDQSDTENPPGITFPTGYARETNAMWRGFYLGRCSMRLPDALRTFDSARPPQIAITNLLIDGSGLTAMIRAENVIQWPRGNFGSWGASIDSIVAEFVSSSLRSGRLVGRLKIPISDSSLNYAAIISRPTPTGPMEFEFAIRPRDTINANLWLAKLSLDPTSRIGLLARSGGFHAAATLNGMFTLQGDVGDVRNIGFRGLRFENFRVLTGSPYVEAGTWRFASEQHGMSGFPISISNIGMVAGDRGGNPGVGIRFTISVNLQSGSNGISGGTQLSIWGAMASSGGSGPSSFRFDGVDLDSIGIRADIGSAVHIEGVLVFYRGNPTYGDGFRGAVRAIFLQQVTVEAMIQFGSVRDFRYWYVDAKAIFSPGIPVFSGVGFYGFGGGAWYHMRRAPGDPPAPTTTTPARSVPVGGTASGYTFIPDDRVALGLRAMVVFGTYPTPDAFNADIAIEAEFLEAGGLGRISLMGQGFMLAGLNDRPSARVRASVDLTYNFPEETFHGVFDLVINADPFRGAGRAVIHVDPTTWYIKVGEPPPANRVRLSLANWLQIDAYVMVGMNLPAPMDLPPEITNILGPLPVSRNPELERGNGFALGASARFGTGRQQFLIFYGMLNVMVGFDIALMDYGAGTTCEGISGPIGINGWYATGQLYAYVEASIGLHVDVWFTSGDFEILGLRVAAALRGGAPNPAWVVGAVGGSYSILGGLISGHCSFQFKVGDECRPVRESPLARMDIVSDISPEDGATNVDVFVEPEAAFNFTMDRQFEIREMVDDTEERVRTFRVKVRDFSLTKTDTRQRLEGRWGLASSGTEATLSPRDMLSGNTRHTAQISAYGEEWIGGRWQTALRRDRTSIEQTVASTFTTGAAPDHIPDRNVAYTYPLNRQRFFLQDECRRGQILLKSGMPDLFNTTPRSPAYRVVFKVRFIPTLGGAEVEGNATYNASARVVTFDIPRLSNSTTYALQLVRREEEVNPMMTRDLGISEEMRRALAESSSASMTTLRVLFNRMDNTARVTERRLPGTRVRPGEKLLYLYYFRTSQFDRLEPKIASLTAEPTTVAPPFGYLELLTARFSGPELFDVYDVRGITFTRDGRENKIGPLVRTSADRRPDRWHTSFTNPWVYNPIQRIRSWRLWYGQTDFERWVNAPHLNLAEFDYTPRPTLYDSEIMPPASAPTSAPTFGGMSFPMPTVPGFSMGTMIRFTADIDYQHGVVVPLDYNRLRQRAAQLISIGDEFYSPEEYAWLRSLVAKAYERFYRGDYTIDFSYGYYGCQDPDTPMPLHSKRFTY